MAFEGGMTMELIRKADRHLKVRDMARALRTVGAGEMTSVETWCKWKELKTGGRLQVKMTIYKMKTNPAVTYCLGDSLDRICTTYVPDISELRRWLVEHGYKTEKKWYLEDYGMTEEAWNEWNGIEA